MLKNKKLIEKELLLSIKNGGDSKAFERLYSSCFPKVKKIVLNTNGDVDEARDVFQDGVLTFYKQVKLNKYQHLTDIDGYIYTICRNLWYTRLKQRNRSSEMRDDIKESYTDFSTPEKDYFSGERDQRVLDLLSQIGERCKELMVNRIYYNMSMKDISHEMGFATEEAAKTKNYKCKQRLISLVKENKFIKELLQDVN
ncbi:MAG: RNA polymerase sigma factor [Cyclobacteriaceae bacterium]